MLDDDAWELEKQDMHVEEVSAVAEVLEDSIPGFGGGRSAHPSFLRPSTA